MQGQVPCAACKGLHGEEGGSPDSPPSHPSLSAWENAPEGQAILECGECGSLWRFNVRFGWSRVQP